MRLIIITMCVLSYITSYSQNCYLVDSFKKFHGFRIGDKLPDSLRKYLTDVEYNHIRNDSSFTLDENTIKENPKFKDWMHVGNIFTDLTIYSTQTGDIYSYLLLKKFGSLDSAAIEQKAFPYFFNDVAEELESIFGKYTKDYQKEETFGKEHIRVWECNDMIIELSFSYTGWFNFHHLLVTDKNLDLKRKISKYTRP